jgi:chromosome segregation ATPase
MSTVAGDERVEKPPAAGEPGASDGAASPAAPPTPSDDLEAKKARLKANQEQLADLNKSASALQDQIKALEVKIADLNQAGQAYQTASEVLAQRLAKVNASITQTIGVAQAVIKEDQASIDKTVADFDAALDAREREAREAATAAETAAQKAREAQADASAAQRDYDSLKRQSERLTAALTTAEDLLVQAGRAQGQNDYAAVYFLATEAGKAVANVKVQSPADYVAALQEKQDAASAKQAAAADQAANGATTATKAAELGRLVASAKASRRGDLLAKLRKAP